MNNLSSEYDVVIAGGGPCGLMLALELGRRHIKVLLLDAKAGTAFNPQANATQARTMEHFRRLGFAHTIRDQGLPPDHPTDIAYFTRLNQFELARLRLPTAREARAAIQTMGGSWSAAELPHRVSQKFVEACLLEQVLLHACVQVRFEHRLTTFEQDDFGVSVRLVHQAKDQPEQAGSVRARYLVGADGARSLVRHQLGLAWLGETGIKRDFMGGKMFAIYFRSQDFYQQFAHDLAWMYVSVHPERRVFMAAVDGQGEFALHAAVHEHENADAWTVNDAQRIVNQVMGQHLNIEVKSLGTWMAGHALYANHFQQGRVFIGGDAAHLFTPTGGLGYNTAVEDAVNLGWKLAHVIQGLAPERLLHSYELERQPLAQRNTTYARQFADSVGMFKASHWLDQPGPQGEAERQRASDHLQAHVRLEFNIPGVTFGGRYDGSPIIVSDGTQPPPDAANHYEPSACPGGRPPHVWLAPDQSLYDRFGPEWTLLVLAPQASHQALVDESLARGLALTVLHLPQPDILALYQAPLALIRPDQVVAWRGQNDQNARAVWAQLLAADA